MTLLIILTIINFVSLFPVYKELIKLRKDIEWIKFDIHILEFNMNDVLKRIAKND